MNFVLLGLVFLQNVFGLDMISSIDMLCNHYKNFYPNWICFSDPACSFVFRQCDMWVARSIILNGRQGTFVSEVSFSERLFISFIVVLFIFMKHIRNVLFPIIVISALIGFVSYLCQDLGCLITGSRFWYFLNNSGVMFSVTGKNLFWVSVFERGIISKGSCKIKLMFIVNFDFKSGGPGNFMLSVRFSSSSKKNMFFPCNFCYGDFCCVLFLMHDECGIRLNLDFRNKSTS